MDKTTKILELPRPKKTLEDTYEIIENEYITYSEFNGLTISGGLFSTTIFKSVTFKNCTFFGSRFENTEFINCRFDNCKFQFCHLLHLDFLKCEFIGNFWDISPIRKSQFEECTLDTKTEYFVKKEDNIILTKEPEVIKVLSLKEETTELPSDFYLKEFLEAA